MIAKSQPSGFYILSFGELCERFSYYGAVAILVLYLTKNFKFSDTKSYLIYGAFTTFAFALPVLGGMIADRFLGFKIAVITGAILLIIGNVLLSMPNFNVFCVGLAVLTCGTGLYKSNSSGWLGTLYPENDKRYDSGFTLFYMWMNVGATLGAIIYGLVASRVGWHVGFMISAVGISFALLMLLITSRSRSDILIKQAKLSTPSIKNKIISFSLMLCVFVLLTFVFFHPDLLGKLLFLFAAIISVVMLFVTAKYQSYERKQIFILLIFAFFSMCFFSASLQVTSSVSLFIERNVNRTIFNWQIPTVLFSSLYPLAVIFMAPFLSWLWLKLAERQQEVSLQIKIPLGLFIGSLAFVCFKLASQTFFPNFQIFWIIIGNLCLGAGELIIFPALMAAITRFAPYDLRGTMIGISFLFVAFAGYISSKIAERSDNVPLLHSQLDKVISAKIYNALFTEISLVLLGISIIAFCLVRVLKNSLVHEK